MAVQVCIHMLASFPGHPQIVRENLGMSVLTYSYSDSELECTMILFIREDCGLHRIATPRSLCFTLVQSNIVSVHLVSREGLQLVGLPLIAWTVTASAAVTEKVRTMLQWSLTTYHGHKYSLCFLCP